MLYALCAAAALREKTVVFLTIFILIAEFYIAETISAKKVFGIYIKTLDLRKRNVVRIFTTFFTDIRMNHVQVNCVD